MIVTSNNNDQDKNYKFSICTPCYNSSDSIEAVFTSLNNLENQNFEWIVVNDASSDNTSDLIHEMLNDAKFSITFCDLEQNKMVTFCYHLAILKAKGEFLIFLDHDDQIKPNALDRFLYHWDILPSIQQDNLAGMIAHCEDEHGVIVGTSFPRSPDVNTFFNLMFDEGVRGEKFFCYKTKIIQENNFQLIDRYVPESNVMWRISAKYETLFFNEALRIYNQPQLGGNNLSMMNPFEYPLGFRLSYLDLLNNYSNQLKTRPHLLLSFLFNFLLFSHASGLGLKSCILDLNNLLHRFIIIPLFSFTFLFYFFKKKLSN